MEKKIKIFKFIIAMLLGVVGVSLIISETSVWVCIGLVLMIWGNNIDQKVL